MKTFLELRTDRNLSKKEVSQATGISVYKLSKFESSDFGNLSTLDFVLLAQHYSVKPSQIKTPFNQKQLDESHPKGKTSLTDEVLNHFNTTINYLQTINN